MANPLQRYSIFEHMTHKIFWLPFSILLFVCNGLHATPWWGCHHFDKQFRAIECSETDIITCTFLEPADPSNVEQFSKLEIGLQLPSDADADVEDFIAGDTSGLNPFDPDEVNVVAVFSLDNLRDTVFGFYYRDFVRDSATLQPFTPAKWLDQPTPHHWRIRFAPPLSGTWNVAVYVYVRGQLIGENLQETFTCVPSANNGFLQAGNDHWHLAYSGTGKSYFAIGQVIPWNDADDIGYGIPYFRGGIARFPSNPSFDKLFHGGMLDVLDWTTEIGRTGGNMVRTAIVPWGFDFEFEKLNNYGSRLNRAWELDQYLENCEQLNMEVSLDLQFFATGNDNPNYQFNWAANPYASLATVQTPDDFLTDPAARRIFRNKLRYFFARWGYSTSLAIVTLTGEIDSWKYKDGPLRSNTIAQKEQLDWYREMLRYSKRQVSYRPLLMTTSYGAVPRMFAHNLFDLPEMDITSLHIYNAERSSNIRRRYNEFNSTSVSKGMHGLWPDKPTYFQEIGIAGYGEDPNDFEGYSDITFHNMIWSTAFMGGFGAGLQWWQHFNSAYRSANFPALHTFFSDVDFQAVDFHNPGVWDDAGPLDFDHSSSTIEAFYISSTDGGQSMGWLHNTSCWWGNMCYDSPDREGKQMRLPSDDDAADRPQVLAPGVKAEIHGLNNLTDYSVTWYSTRGNGGAMREAVARTNIFGTLRLHWPDDTAKADVAFKASANRAMISSRITTDTLLCWQDTIEARGNYAVIGQHALHYHWDFGNGMQSDVQNAIAIYSRPGKYTVRLIVSDEDGWSDTLEQLIIKPGRQIRSVDQHFLVSACSRFRKLGNVQNSVFSGNSGGKKRRTTPNPKSAVLLMLSCRAAEPHKYNVESLRFVA